MFKKRVFCLENAEDKRQKHVFYHTWPPKVGVSLEVYKKSSHYVRVFEGRCSKNMCFARVMLIQDDPRIAQEGPLARHDLRV